MMGLPVFFVPFVIRFPAGLLVYWITTNLWTVGQGLVIRRFSPHPAPPPAGKDGGPSRGSPGGLLGAARSMGLSDDRGSRTDQRAEQRDENGASAEKPSRAAAPPPPPRKKKKRSGRRR
jgi:YidC/Oxa1 family membrane protein insertase